MHAALHLHSFVLVIQARKKKPTQWCIAPRLFQPFLVTEQESVGEDGVVGITKDAFFSILQ
jgi:hypothetical protein